MSADDSVGDLGKESLTKGDTIVPAKKAKPIPIHKAIFDAWADLFRSRESLLIRVYMQWIGDLGGDLVSPVTLREVRRRFYTAKGTPEPPDSVSDSLESRIVLLTRIIAAWIVFWTTIAPAAIVAWAVVNTVLRMPNRNWRNLGSVPITVVILFPVLSVIGLFVQSILVGPFNALISRLFVMPEYNPIHPPDVESPLPATPDEHVAPDHGP